MLNDLFVLLILRFVNFKVNLLLLLFVEEIRILCIVFFLFVFFEVIKFVYVVFILVIVNKYLYSRGYKIEKN